jgi:hypothetical protein
VTTKVNNLVTYTPGALTLQIGVIKLTNGTLDWMNGTLDEVRIFNKALSADEISETMSKGYYSATCDSKRDFASLDLQNGATLTHVGLTAQDMNQDINGNYSLADETVGDARWKKVDLVVTGDLTLETGGKIVADGLGYPGLTHGTDAVTSGHCNTSYGTVAGSYHSDGLWYGFGPAGGYASQSNNDYSHFWEWGNGGGFGGGGGTGGAGSTTYTGAYNFQNTTTNHLEWGSGGGGVGIRKSNSDDVYSGFGGSGGGAISISAASIKFLSATSKISANGNNAPAPQCNDGGDIGGTSGGGAGGVIHLMTNQLYYPPDLISTYVLPTVKSGATQGQNGQYVNNSTTNNAVYQLSAHGGNTDQGAANGGGGGWLVIEPLVSVSTAPHTDKTLMPILRPGITCRDANGNVISGKTDCFDPYGMQAGDIVQVILDITGLDNTASSLQDNRMYTPGSSDMVCQPYMPGDTDYSPFHQMWKVTNSIGSFIPDADVKSCTAGICDHASVKVDVTDGDSQVGYYCKVMRKP